MLWCSYEQCLAPPDRGLFLLGDYVTNMRNFNYHVYISIED